MVAAATNNPLNKMFKKIFLTSVSLLVCTCLTFSQNKFRVSSGNEFIEIVHHDSTTAKSIDVFNRNPFTKINLPAEKIGNKVRFTITDTSRAVIDQFFEHLKSPYDHAMIKPTKLVADSEVATTRNYLIIADHLTMLGEGGILGVKSRAEVYDDKGNLIHTLPENNDGYFAPIITDDGKYLATQFGDIVPDADFTLMPPPGIRIYETRTNAVIVEMKSDPAFSIYPPAKINNLILIVRGTKNDFYEYNIIDPSTRTCFTRNFSNEELSGLKDITAFGFVFQRQQKKEVLAYENNFVKKRF